MKLRFLVLAALFAAVSCGPSTDAGDPVSCQVDTACTRGLVCEAQSCTVHECVARGDCTGDQVCVLLTGNSGKVCTARECTLDGTAPCAAAGASCLDGLCVGATMAELEQGLKDGPDKTIDRLLAGGACKGDMGLPAQALQPHPQQLLVVRDAMSRQEAAGPAGAGEERGRFLVQDLEIDVLGQIGLAAQFNFRQWTIIESKEEALLVFPSATPGKSTSIESMESGIIVSVKERKCKLRMSLPQQSV